MGAREEQQDRFVARAVGLDPGRVLADARNAAHDYVADGIDAVETVLRHELDWRVEAKARALEGLERVHERLQDALRATLAAFERHARASAFAVPPAVLRGAHGPAPAPGDPGAPSGSSAGHDEVRAGCSRPEGGGSRPPVTPLTREEGEAPLPRLLTPRPRLLTPPEPGLGLEPSGARA